MKRAVKSFVMLLLGVIMALSFAGCGDNTAKDKGNVQQPVDKLQVNQSETIASSTVIVHEGSSDDSEHGHGHGHSEHSSGDIGYDKVRDIVLSKVPGATDSDFDSLERDHNDGRIKYDGSIYYNEYRYEFEIDGTTGNILQWEIDN